MPQGQAAGDAALGPGRPLGKWIERTTRGQVWVEQHTGAKRGQQCGGPHPWAAGQVRVTSLPLPSDVHQSTRVSLVVGPLPVRCTAPPSSCVSRG